jgi:hypothetical protein
MDNKNFLIPFCIYYKINPEMNENEGVGESTTYISHVGAPEMVVNNDGSDISFECMKTTFIYSSWFEYATFYALNPQFRPIPKGMILLCAEWKRGDPYNTVNIKHVIDPFYVNVSVDFDSGCIYFYAYDRPVKGTVPLNLFMNSEGLFPTFENEPPKSRTEKWTKSPLEKIYVFAPGRTSLTTKIPLTVEDINSMKFINKNDTCIPIIKGEESDAKGEKIYNNIGECVVDYSNFPIVSLLDMIVERTNIQNKNKIKKIFNDIPQIYTSIILAIFTVSFIMIVILLIK